MKDKERAALRVEPADDNGQVSQLKGQVEHYHRKAKRDAKELKQLDIKCGKLQTLATAKANEATERIKKDIQFIESVRKTVSSLTDR